MPTFREYSRRAIQPLIGLVLVSCYVLILLPLSKQNEGMDQPLEKAWRKLAASVGRTNALMLDFQQMKAQLDETRQAWDALSTAEHQAMARLGPSDALRALMSGPFRLVDYQTELSKFDDELRQKAKVQQVQLGPNIFEGMPQHRVEIPEQAKPLLWGALRMTQDTLNSALACGISALHTLEVNASFTNAPALDQANRWVEVPIELEFTATFASAARFFHSLGLRNEEIKAAGLPHVSAEKNVLFIQRFMIKRQNPEKTDEVRVWVRVAGFILRE